MFMKSKLNQRLSPKTMQGVLFALCLVLCLMALCSTNFASQAFAQSALSQQNFDYEERLLAEDLPWILNADNLATLSGDTIVEARGNVVLNRGGDTLKADFIRYFSDTGWVYLEGNVTVQMKGDVLEASSAEFDLESQVGWLTNGKVFMEGPHVYFSGSHMVRNANDQYAFTNARITTCDGDNPAWSLEAGTAIVEIDGYAQLYRANVSVKDQGVLYSPYFILPAKTSRQSGFLIPDYGYSTRRGVYYTQPYYHVIDESSDLTLYGTIMTEIGPMLGLEYRSNRLSTEKTWLMASFGYDRSSINNLADDEVYPGNPALRTNHGRYWLRGMADGHFGETEWRYRSDFDYVSDQNYLREFDSDMFGFDYSRDALFSMFGRDLNDYNENRESAFNIYRDWERFSFVMSARYTQDPSLGHGNRPLSEDETVQSLPQFDFFFNKSRIFPNIPLELEAHLQSGYFYRAEGTRGLRTEIIPRLSLPLNFRYFSLIGTVGLNQTFYSTSTESNTSPFNPYATNNTAPLQTGTERSLVDYSIKAFTEANRIWELDAKPLAATKENVGKTSWTAVRHDIQPRAEYTYTPRKYQDDNPFYTVDDRILSESELVYSVTNIITRKGKRIVVADPKQPDKITEETVYEDLARLRILSGYDFEEDERDYQVREYERRPFMDILTDVEVYLAPWATVEGKMYISPYDAEITRLDYGMDFAYKHYASWYTGLSYRTENYNIRRQLRYDNPDSILESTPENLMHNRLELTLSPEWSIMLEDYRDLDRGGSFGEAYNQTVQLAYDAQCYRIIAAYRYDDYDRSYSLMIEIPGIFE